MRRSIPRATWVASMLVALSISLLGGSPAALAQSIFANLSGTITDSNGALIPGAKVTIVNGASNIAQHLVSNKEGFFSAAQLPVGTYSVSVEAKGFEKWNGEGIVLNASDVRSLTIPLKVGAESMTVEVSASAGQIDITDSGAKVETITSEDLEKQPLIGRNATEILRIIPGSAQITLSGTNRPAADGSMIGVNGFTVNGSAGGMAAVSINGQSGTGISINEDGQNTEDPGSPGSATPVNPNPDMISEIQVMTSNYGADNAKGPVVINTLSKSGGSEFHGDLHYYARNSVLNAEEANNKQQEVQNGYAKGYLFIPSHYNYPGGTVGGPLVIPHTRFNSKSKTKLFFHEAFEYYDQLIDGGINDAFLPTADMIKTGDFSALGTTAYTNMETPAWSGAPQLYNSIASRGGVAGVPVTPTNSGLLAERPGCSITNGTMTQGCISPDAQLWMEDSLVPANLSAPNSQGWNYVSPVQQSQNSWHNMAKLDMNFTDNTKAYISWSRQHENAIEPLGLWQGSGDWVIPSPSEDLSQNTSDLYTVNFLHTFSSSLTVEARFGYTHLYMPGAPQSPDKVLRADMNFPTPMKGVFGNPNAPIATSWSGNIPNIGDIGHDYHPAFYAEKGIPSSGADLTKVFKTHTFKFGFLWENIYNAQDAWSQYMGVYGNYDGGWGNYTGNNYADLLMGANQSYYEQALPPIAHMQQASTSLYATDHWKLNRRLTLDYGMRFEHFGAPNSDNQIGAAVFNPTTYGNDVSAGKENPGVSWHGLDSSIPISGSTQAFLDYSPRLGASIDVYGNGKTVVRGGWGMYRYAVNLQDDHQGAANTAFGSVGWSSPGAAATWEDVDQFANVGGSCAAAQPGGIDAGHTSDCAPAVVFGKATNMANSSITVLDARDKDQPYTVTYSLNIDQQFPDKFMAEISYVGNHSALGQSGINFNAVPIGTMTSAANISTISGASQLTLCAGLDTANITTDPAGVLAAQQNDAQCQQKYRPYPYYQGISADESAQIGQYDSLQGKLTRSSTWATASFNYAWSKNFTNPTQTAAYKDYGEKEYWNVINYNRKHVFNASYVFSTPKVHLDNRFLSGAANGYQLSGITQIQSGAMLSAVNGYYYNMQNGPSVVYSIGTPDATIAPNITCNPHEGLQKHQFVNPSCFAFPFQGTGIGNTRMPALPGPMYWSSDLATQKSFAVTEHQNLELRFTAKDFLNHDLLSFAPSDPNLELNFSNGSGSAPLGTLQNAKTFGYATTFYGHRTLELSAKYSF